MKKTIIMPACICWVHYPNEARWTFGQAFGLKITGISSRKFDGGLEGSLKNNHLYNDKELWDDAGLDWYDYGFRNYDAQVARFVQLDPLTWAYLELTPYQYASNDPITNIDIDGLEGAASNVAKAVEKAVWANAKVLEEVSVMGLKKLSWWEKTWESVKKVADVVTDFVPIVSGVKDIYRGLKNGNWVQVGIGVLSVGVDILTVGTAGAIAKGIIKTGLRRGRKAFIEEEAEQVFKKEVIGAAGKNAIVKQAAKGGINLTRSQLKSVSSLERQIAKHEAKLAEYIKNPMKFDNKGFLKNAPSDAIRQKIIKSRINHLQQEIKTFQNNIQKIINGQ